MKLRYGIKRLDFIASRIGTAPKCSSSTCEEWLRTANFMSCSSSASRTIAPSRRVRAGTGPGPLNPNNREDRSARLHVFVTHLKPCDSELSLRQIDNPVPEF